MGRKKALGRRRFLSTALVGSLGVAGYLKRPSERTLNVRVWISSRAAEYEGLSEVVLGYLRRALADTHDAVELSYGGTVDVATEHAYDVVMSGDWPRRVLSGSLGLTDTDAVDDVNLLVTDGSLAETPSAAGAVNVAAAGGARFIAKMPPPSELPSTVSLSVPALATQVLVHECGHALGLHHRHGAVYDRGEGTVVTPMVSAYAWAPAEVREKHLGHSENACGTGFEPVTRRRARMSLVYSECARQRIESYRGGPIP